MLVDIDKETEAPVSGRFDEPIVLRSGNSFEPVRYVAEHPYDLTKYEFSILQNSDVGSFWFGIFAGGTAGLVLSVAGKALQALLSEQKPSIESWELWAIGAGVAVSVAFSFIPTKQKKENKEIERLIGEHFKGSRPRRVHLHGDSKE